MKVTQFTFETNNVPDEVVKEIHQAITRSLLSYPEVEFEPLSDGEVLLVDSFQV